MGRSNVDDTLNPATMDEIVKYGVSMLVRPSIPNDATAVYQIISKNMYYLRHVQTNPDDIWLDIGAHVGSFGIGIAKRVQKVYLVEPVPDNAEMVQINIEHNNLANAEVIEKAVIGRSTPASGFFVNRDSKSLIHGFRSRRGREEINVEMITVDDLLAVTKANAVKICAANGEQEIAMGSNWEGVNKLVLGYDFYARDDAQDHSQYDAMITHLKRCFPNVRDTEPSIERNAWHSVVNAWR